MKRVPCIALLLVVLVAQLTGCGGGDGATVVEETAAARKSQPAPELHVTLDSREGPQSIGLLIAERRGYFQDAGLDVSVANPLEPNRPVSYVAKGTDEFGLAQQPQVAIAREKGMPIVAIGSVIPHSTDAMIWLKRSKIDGISDLKGKTIAVPGIPYQERMLRKVLARAGLTPADVNIERAVYDLAPALLEGRADAIFGASWNIEGVELRVRGAEPVITRVEDLGVPDYEGLVVIASTKLVAEDPQRVRDFMSAFARGMATAIGHPEVVARTIVPYADLASSRESMEAQIRATLPLLSTSGYMDPDRAQRLVDWMGKEGLLEKSPPAASLLSNGYR